jgi:hypothetical protein
MEVKLDVAETRELRDPRMLPYLGSTMRYLRPAERRGRPGRSQLDPVEVAGQALPSGPGAKPNARLALSGSKRQGGNAAFGNLAWPMKTVLSAVNRY